ncbi:helix-turn-helix domain-containing protein [Sinorhizobium fredii]|uniref:helix-turn-helix domain-containing protein n=1 Tax=Rhizobium fredii TaxID=380 RepID=UPI0004B3F55B|nr:helix-turn-helix domain-containing protein [Sinorhizobium fredii]
MIVEDGYYSIPILPREIASRLKDKPEWPAELRNEYKRLHAEFTASKAEFSMWVRRDRDSRMNRTAKTILLLILDCLNFDTGRCDPGHQFIADELGVSVRTVERTIPRIAASGWLSITRRGKTTTNFYRPSVPTQKVAAILDYADGLREQRSEERERRRQLGDPTKMADHSASDPTMVRIHDPTELAGKPMNRTFEEEPLKESSCSEGREDTYPRESIPTDETQFGPWVKANIHDPTQRREALRLLRERKMTPEILRRMAA